MTVMSTALAQRALTPPWCSGASYDKILEAIHFWAIARNIQIKILE
jgi:hypothetical protein